MFDHVGIRVADRETSERFYDTVLGAIGRGRDHTSAAYTEWGEWAIGSPDDEHPLTRGLHAGFYVPDRELVHAFWEAGTAAGYADDGAPGSRTHYGDDYYGAFLLDPDGNSIEAMTHEADRETGQVDHLWIRVADVEASKAFYAAIAPYTGYAPVEDESDPPLARFRSPTGTFSVLRDERARTENVHLAFPGDRAAVDGFHAAAVAAGHADNGAPGLRPEYHATYYGAFVRDPDGHNVEVVNHGSR